MRNEKKRTEDRGQKIEFGIGNAEFGMRKRGQKTEVFEFGMGNGECGKGH